MNKKEERYDRILVEASRLFAEKGYEQTTVSDIVKACDMARGTFYLYFESLEQVLTALFSNVMNLMWQEVERNLEGNMMGEAVLRNIITSVFHLLVERKELLSVFHCGGGQRFNEFKYRTIREHLGVYVANLISESQTEEHDDMRPCSPELVAMMIATLIDQMAYITVVLEQGMYDQEFVVAELVDFIMFGVCKPPQQDV
ncbi:MAG: TetR/AcrR family transcriptional regulator [Tumebacillaceae bacterium]